MYAVVEIAGQQFKVKKDDVVLANRLPGEQGDEISIDKVLLVSDEQGIKVGAPYVDGAKVTAAILEQTRGEKVLVFKKKRRKRYKVLKGHRQLLTALQIKEITA